MERIFNFTANKCDIGKTIKDILKNHYKMSAKLIATLKSYDDGICINGVHQRVNYVLKNGDILSITMRESSSENIVPTPMKIDIVYEDEDIAVVNKSPNLPTHPCMGSFENTLANGMMFYWQSKGESYIFRAVNRLDKDTSGLMVIAKNAYSHARLCEQLIQKTMKRSYQAIVCGIVPSDGTVNAPIKRQEDSIITRCVSPDGASAITHYHVIDTYNDLTLVDLVLETGRTHQIRVHMSHIGYPILGDWLYGNENDSRLNRQALHSATCSFTHPVTQKPLSFSQDIPSDMMSVLKNKSY